MTTTTPLHIRNQLTELDSVFSWLTTHLAPLERENAADAHANDLKVVADEILANSIEYGYENNAEGKISLHLHIDKQSITLRIQDDAAPFNPLACAPPDLDMPTESRETGGMGVLLIRQLTDTQEYVYQDGHNILTVTRLRNR